MKPQSCKSKGRRLQQKVASSIRKAFPHLKEDDCVSTSMGAPGEDVRLSPAARECLPLSIECKNVEKINVWACLEQCVANTPAGASPCLIFTRNHRPTYACLPWEALLDLYRARNAGAVPPRVAALVRELHAMVEEEVAPPPPSPRGGGGEEEHV